MIIIRHFVNAICNFVNYYYSSVSIFAFSHILTCREVTNAVDEEEEERERKAEQFRLEREAALQKARQEKAEIEAAERQRR